MINFQMCLIQKDMLLHRSVRNAAIFHPEGNTFFSRKHLLLSRCGIKGK